MSEQHGVGLADALFEGDGAFSVLGCAVGNLVHREYSINISIHQIIFPFQSIINQVLKLLHLDFHNDFIYRVRVVRIKSRHINRTLEPPLLISLRMLFLMLTRSLQIDLVILLWNAFKN